MVEAITDPLIITIKQSGYEHTGLHWVTSPAEVICLTKYFTNSPKVRITSAATRSGDTGSRLSMDFPTKVLPSCRPSRSTFLEKTLEMSCFVAPRLQLSMAQVFSCLTKYIVVKHLDRVVNETILV